MGQSASNQSNKAYDDESSTAQMSLPIVYDCRYNLRMMGFEKFSKFDVRKSEKISQILVKNAVINEGSFATPTLPSDEDLKKVHTVEYLESLKEKATIASISGISLLKVMPSSFVHNTILNPFRLQAGGTLLAGSLAVDHGWAINLGGGQHHCSHDRATPGGFSMFADITMNVRFIQEKHADIEKVLIIDLDVHQGNGYGRDFIGDDNVYIFDVYNSEIFPHDEEAKVSIRRKVELKSGTGDEDYLAHISDNVTAALDEFEPHYVIYNAGVDILKGDPLGLLNVTQSGVIERDVIVFKAVRSRNIPIVMLLSGGFSKKAGEVVGSSITRLHEEGLIKGPKTIIGSQS